MRIFFTVFAILVAAGCGNNKKEQNKPEAGETDDITPPVDEGNEGGLSTDSGQQDANFPDNSEQDLVGPKAKSGGGKNLRKPHNISKPAENEVEIGTGDRKKKVKTRGSYFTGGDRVGDFNWMIDRPQYTKTFFVFYDNEEQFLAFHGGDLLRYGCLPGGGNAGIRPKQCATPPRAAGVPISTIRGGYKTLDANVKGLIEQSIAHIRKVLEEGDYDTVLFSQALNTRMIDTDVAGISNDIREYIFQSLLNLNAE